MDLVRKLALVTTAFVTICVLTTCRLSWLCLDDLLISHRGLYLPPAQNFLLKASQFPGIVDVVVAAIAVLAVALLFVKRRIGAAAIFVSFCIALAAVTASVTSLGLLTFTTLCFR